MVRVKCEVEAVLDHVARCTLFTEIRISPSLTISSVGQMEKAEKLLHKAEVACLITNSLNSEISTNIDILITSD